MLQYAAMKVQEAPQTADRYNGYAAVYDRSGQMRFSILMAMYLREVLARHPALGNRMVDLACGTGTLALMQAEAGWEVRGIDAALPMLDQARRKQEAAGVEVAFVHGDMRDFVTPGPVDLVTCFYDSLNYLLTEEELLMCFGAIRQALVPGGLCCFDLATEHFLREYWRGVETYEADGYRHVMESSFDEVTSLSTLILKGSDYSAEDTPTSFQEVHVERAFTADQVERLLCRAGLRCEALYDCFTFQAPGPQSLRHFWVARRPTNDH